MMNTVAAVASAMKSPRWVCSPSARNASSGPYADDDNPSAPSPTHARNAAGAMCWRVVWLTGSSGAPMTSRRIFSYVVMAASGLHRGSWRPGLVVALDHAVKNGMLGSIVVALRHADAALQP